MKRTLLLLPLLCAGTARADATLFILHGGIGRTVIARTSLVVTSGADGSLDFYDVRDDLPSLTPDAARWRAPEVPVAPGRWIWRLHSKAGVETGGGRCTAHTEQRTGTDGGGVFVWLDCEPTTNNSHGR